MANIYRKLNQIQVALKAPKNQYNSFGKFKYRSCEDILIAVKPYLEKLGLVLLLSDCIKQEGDRFYVVATATLVDIDGNFDPSSFAPHTIHCHGSAREDKQKKGMDESQITGKASSYARKYALSGLFALDDEKDADTQDNTKQENRRTFRTKQNPGGLKSQSKNSEYLISKEQRKQITNIAQQHGISREECIELLAAFGYTGTNEVTIEKFPKVLEAFQAFHD